MFKCEICGKEFENSGFAYHLTHSHKDIFEHNGNIQKSYYDKYLRKPGEGICPKCGEETEFISLSKGYKKEHKGDCNFRCAICNKQINGFTALSRHVVGAHKDHYGQNKDVLKEYYDEFLRTPDETGKCKKCGRDTEFVSLSYGYRKQCLGTCGQGEIDIECAICGNTLKVTTQYQAI